MNASSPMQGSSGSAPADPYVQGVAGFQGAAVLNPPALVALNGNTGVLEMWPIQHGGGTHPQALTNSLGLNSSGMAADGDVVILANQHNPAVLLINVVTKNRRTLPDPFGTPLDIAIGKHKAIYVLNLAGTGNVAMYRPGSTQPIELACGKIGFGEAIAVDNEANIYINGYGPRAGPGVVEIPNGPNGPEPQNCKRLDLKEETGYVAGLAIDPKTDDLIVFNDPDLCAGGNEGLMTVYSKPYQKATGVTRLLGGNCAGGLRLSADSTVVFYGDEDVSGSHTFIRQASFPEGKSMGTYTGGQPEGFTTIPNSLPN